MSTRLGSPQVYRERGLRFAIYYNEGNEPPHIHVERGDGRDIAAKFWLNPIELCWNEGFNAGEIRWIVKQLNEHHARFMEEWYVIEAKKR